MFQLLASMKRLDEFKACYARKHADDSDADDRFIIGKILSNVGHENTAEAQGRISAVPESTIRPSDPAEGCPRCGGAVFEAERMKSRFRCYHKACFTCAECHRALDSTRCCDAPDRDVYCTVCYARKFGPHGYGFGSLHCDPLQSDDQAAGSSVDRPHQVNTSSIKPADGSTGCARCGGAVFAAELMLSNGREWHASCYRCRECRRLLDSTTACDGPDRELYCRQDYARRFGISGVGFGQAPTLLSFNAPPEQC